MDDVRSVLAEIRVNPGLATEEALLDARLQLDRACEAGIDFQVELARVRQMEFELLKRRIMARNNDVSVGTIGDEDTPDMIGDIYLSGYKVTFLD